MLRAHDRLPHFVVTTIDGQRAAYADVWQRKHVLLAMLPDSDSAPSRAYAGRLRAALEPLGTAESVGVITGERLEAMSRPGVVIADRWGEIVMVAEANAVEDLPPVEALIEWLHYLDHQCPECEGEAK